MKNYEEVGRNVFRRRDEFEASRKQQKQTLRRKVNTTLAVLAIFVAVAGTVGFAVKYISGTELFKGFFKASEEIELSEAQNAIIEERVIEVQKSVTKDDIKLTLDGVLVHRGEAYIYMTVEAPDDISLEYCNASGIALKGKKGYTIAEGYRLGTNEYDSETNSMKYMLRVSMPQINTSVYEKSDGEITVVISGFMDGSTFEPISEEVWEFSVVLPPPDEPYIEVLSEPFTFEMDDIWSGEKAEIQITTLQIYEFSANMEFDVLTEGEFNTSPEVLVVLKNGTEISADSSQSQEKFGVGDSRVCVCYFESPVVAADVDYIKIGISEFEDGMLTYNEYARIDFPQQ